MTTNAILFLVSGLIMFGVSLPLIYRKIPPNHFYGFRVKASFVSKEHWYAINAYSGQLLAKWSSLPIAAGVAGLFLPGDCFTLYTGVAAALLVVSALVPTLLTLRWIRKTYGR